MSCVRLTKSLLEGSESFVAIRRPSRELFSKNRWGPFDPGPCSSVCGRRGSCGREAEPNFGRLVLNGLPAAADDKYCADCRRVNAVTINNNVGNSFDRLAACRFYRMHEHFALSKMLWFSR